MCGLTSLGGDGRPLGARGRPVPRALLTSLGIPFCLLLLSACDGETLGPEPFFTTGTVEFVVSEGEGCWTIASEGRTFEPVSLPEAYRQDGARIRFEGVIRRELEGSCDLGPVVEIHWIIQLPRSD